MGQSQPRLRHLQHAPQQGRLFVQGGTLAGIGLQQVVKSFCLAPRLGTEDGDMHAVMRPRCQQTLVLQQLECFAHRRTADAVMLHQLPLVDGLARQKLAVQNAPAHIIDQVFTQGTHWRQVTRWLRRLPAWKAFHG